jgi:hypothetical protein
MNSAKLGRRNSLRSALLGLGLVGLALGQSALGTAAERDGTPREAMFVAQTLPRNLSRLAPITADPELRPAPARSALLPSPLPDLDAGELFPAESFAETAELPTCSTVASLAEGLLGTCLRQGLTAAEQALTLRLLYGAAQPNRTDAWSRDTESLFRLAQCAGSLADQRLVAGAALTAAEAELQNPASLSAPPLSASRREHTQRAQWLWTYRLATLDVAQGHYLRAAATLFRLHRTAPTRSLLPRISAARQVLLQLHSGELH